MDGVRALITLPRRGDALSASDFRSSDSLDPRTRADRQNEYRKKMELLTKPVVNQIYKLLHRLRDLASKTSNQAMSLSRGNACVSSTARFRHTAATCFACRFGAC